MRAHLFVSLLLVAATGCVSEPVLRKPSVNEPTVILLPVPPPSASAPSPSVATDEESAGKVIFSNVSSFQTLLVISRGEIIKEFSRGELFTFPHRGKVDVHLTFLAVERREVSGRAVAGETVAEGKKTVTADAARRGDVVHLVDSDFTVLSAGGPPTPPKTP